MIFGIYIFLYLIQDQSYSSSDGPENIPSIPTSIVPSNNEPINLDIPITIRKEVRSYASYPIAKYLSYQKLSSIHKAFTYKISQLFIPRNI